MLALIDANKDFITSLSTLFLLFVTAWYAWTTRALLKEAEQSRMMASEPRVVAYLRAHEVHSNIVQLCIANLADAGAVGVSAAIKKLTEWPKELDFGDAKILRDIGFLRPHEVLKFDLGMGPDLFKDGSPASFEVTIRSKGLDGRAYTFETNLSIESVAGFSSWRVYGVDDIARRLDDISKTLASFSGIKRLKVDTFNASDRTQERTERERQREILRQRGQGSE